MKELLNKIQAPYQRAFAWRVYNTFKSIVLPVALPVILANVEYFQDNVFLMFISRELWLNLAYVSFIALIGSAIAGLDKVNRMGDGDN
jgi:hypothetical protein